MISGAFAEPHNKFGYDYVQKKGQHIFLYKKNNGVETQCFYAPYLQY